MKMSLTFKSFETFVSNVSIYWSREPKMWFIQTLLKNFSQVIYEILCLQKWVKWTNRWTEQAVCIVRAEA